MDDRTEREALTDLLDALDRRDGSLTERLAHRPRDGAFLGLLATEGLQDIDAGLLLAALSNRLGGQPHVAGAELAAAATTGTAARLAAVARLDAEAPLVSSGLLLPDAPPQDAADAMLTCYRLADQVLRAACRVFGSAAPVVARPSRGPYRSNGELLADLRRLSLHYRRRAARVFDLDPWVGTGLESHSGSEALVRRAREAAAHVAARMAGTDAGFPIMQLKSRHGLDLDSIVVLVTLLFQEVLEGVAVVDAVDLARLVSESEEALLRRRHMLRPLERAGLLRLEGSYAGKDLTADASLPNRVIDDMVGVSDTLGADDKLDFHAWLKDLDGSDSFFFDLDSDGP